MKLTKLNTGNIKISDGKKEWIIGYSADGYSNPYGIVLPGEDVFRKIHNDRSAKLAWKKLKPIVDKYMNIHETKFYAFWNGKKHEIEGTSLWDAKQKAIKQLKVPKSKVGLLAVVNANEHEKGSFVFDSVKEGTSSINWREFYTMAKDTSGYNSEFERKYSKIHDIPHVKDALKKSKDFNSFMKHIKLFETKDTNMKLTKQQLREIIREEIQKMKGLTEGRAFVAAAKKAKDEGKTEFEFDGKTYPVTIKD